MKKCPFQDGDVCRPDCALYDRLEDACAFLVLARELNLGSTLFMQSVGVNEK